MAAAPRRRPHYAALQLDPSEVSQTLFARSSPNSRARRSSRSSITHSSLATLIRQSQRGPLSSVGGDAARQLLRRLIRESQQGSSSSVGGHAAQQVLPAQIINEEEVRAPAVERSISSMLPLPIAMLGVDPPSESATRVLPSYNGTCRPSPTVQTDQLSAEIDGEDECCICLEMMGPPQSLRVFPCLHKLHAQCAVAWLHTENAQRGCPQCRRPANLSQTILVTLPVDRIGLVMSEHLATSPGINLQAPPPSDEVARLMESCCCSQEVAQESLRRADWQSVGAPDEDAVSAAEGIIEDRLNRSGTGLLEALKANDLFAVDRHLQSQDAALSIRDKSFGKTALIIASQKRFRAVVQKMCEMIVAGVAGRGSSIDTQDDEGYTALMWSSLRGHTEICTVLLAYSELLSSDCLGVSNP
eukprot:gnl/MRDRNA2_/MRDRNA2_99117_c0_seq1.p1 gnl/MRDRNA2_/MRDRNA2_99117_c0~~gnl/MRDRNA2_/MRDRNA2_99117_c0_seq1.p1  ORF type:complete len:415 (+),score=65.98 gnl/MRDRNA2_/MRDRNA2_99117_c0_seq1:78-1322(+)